ncbi:uncharacterized protein LACBIDRAFT_330689 [Laccaria bicolor S238N-H82]|uniref:Predicted protein n=1 Tax=Laccaria bicolor (strain S238N-H82 / ATCC MYA-4686) TaxID=486041 RepID=B0DM49_LACBS|nr:uncharacterized protein LACBIDRAFT_330689 [Laccaria bicolor S238N-H82]EDR04503.1 predicted protein [Laccaria bicolor S238N-H82]|eukprot:XP_001885022.1 predicted protein [Laccaria bicolor S238N-H82]
MKWEACKIPVIVVHAPFLEPVALRPLFFDATRYGTWPFLSVNFAFLTFLPSLFSSLIAMPDNDIPMDPPASSPPPDSPTLANTHGSASKRKRSSTPPEPGPSKTKRSRKSVVPARSKKGKRPSDWHLTKGEIPEKSEATKLALQVHCQALWQLLSQNSVPPKVTLVDRAHYNSRFSSESAIKSSVHASLDANSVDINQAQSRVQQLLDSLTDLNSTTANHIQRIDESFLCLMFRTISFFGLARWAPDVLSQDPNSMYNLLHEHIALVTFEQVAAGFGYSHLGIDLSLIRNSVLMRKLYCNFVYSYMHGIAKSERQVRILKAQGFNERTVDLADEAEAHSDDELAEGDSGSQLTYHIKVKDGCSIKVKSFFWMLDSQPPKLQFDPGYWNTTLTVRERLDYIEHGVRIGLPLAEHCQTWEQCSLWKNLPKEEFMKTYGNAVLALYKMPTKEEVTQL